MSKHGRGSDQFPLRLPEGMRQRIAAAAEANGRSMNAEIVHALEREYLAKPARSSEPLDLLWGADAIGRVIGRNSRQTFHMLESGELPAKQVGSRWVISRQKLVEFFLGDAP